MANETSWKALPWNSPFFTTYSNMTTPATGEFVSKILANSNVCHDYKSKFPGLPYPDLFFAREHAETRGVFPHPRLLYKMHPLDVNTLALYRTNSIFLSKIITDEKKGGRNLLTASDEIENFFQRRDYVSLIKLIWADQINRLDWLKKNEYRLPPIFLFERGVAEFRADATVKTLKSVVYPLFNLAKTRIIEDSLYFKDESGAAQSNTTDVADSLFDLYMQCLSSAFDKYATDKSKAYGFKKYISPDQSTKYNRYTITMRINYLQSLQNTQPSDFRPFWLMYNTSKYLGAQIEGAREEEVEQELFHDLDTCNAVRREWAARAYSDALLALELD